MAWRDLLRPASFRGVQFKVETATKGGGRRGVNFEFPKRDDPEDEDMGRRAKRWGVSGYVIGPDYHIQADELERALNAEGPGRLVHPMMGEMRVRCETYNRSERRTEGGMATFDMSFVEAPEANAASRITEDTQGILKRMAEGAANAAAAAADKQEISL